MKGSEGMDNQYNEEAKVDNEAPKTESDYVYKTVIKNKQNRRTWSVVSLGLAVVSVLSFSLSWFSLIFGVLSVGAAIVSRKNLGYFDKLSLAGIIVGIFGVVFSVAGIIFESILSGILL